MEKQKQYFKNSTALAFIAAFSATGGAAALGFDVPGGDLKAALNASALQL